MSHSAIPRHIWKAMEEEKEEKRTSKKAQQQQLDFKTVKGPNAEFTRAGTLHAVTVLVAINNQVSCSLSVYHELKRDNSMSLAFGAS